MDKEKQILELGRLIRRDVLELCERTNTGHVGSAFSVADILAALYSEVLQGNPTDPDRDRLILSKGHACAALYSILSRKGILSSERLSTFASNGATLGHPPAFRTGYWSGGKHGLTWTRPFDWSRLGFCRC